MHHKLKQANHTRRCYLNESLQSPDFKISLQIHSLAKTPLVPAKGTVISSYKISPQNIYILFVV